MSIFKCSVICVTTDAPLVVPLPFHLVWSNHCPQKGQWGLYSCTTCTCLYSPGFGDVEETGEGPLSTMIWSETKYTYIRHDPCNNAMIFYTFNFIKHRT